MKSLFIVLSCLVILGSTAHAQSALLGANIAGALTTETVNGSTPTIKTIPVTARSILKAVFSSGTSGAAKESDLALALQINLPFDLYVINTTNNNAIVATIAEPGSSSSSTGITYKRGKVVHDLVSASDVEFTIP